MRIERGGGREITLWREGGRGGRREGKRGGYIEKEGKGKEEGERERGKVRKERMRESGRKKEGETDSKMHNSHITVNCASYNVCV